MKKIKAVFLVAVCSILLTMGIKAQDFLFAVGNNYPIANQPHSVASADLDGDDILDLVVASRTYPSSGCVSVLKGNGDGTFRDAVDYMAGSQPHNVCPADFDSDGDLDLAVADVYNAILILKNNGDGTFQSPLTYPAGNGPNCSIAVDLDNDGDLDIPVPNHLGDNVSILLNDGDGAFQNAANYGVGDFPGSISSGDYDSDGDLDLSTSNAHSDNVSILINNGNGTFQSAINYAAGGSPHSVFSADLDLDGDLDLAVANNISGDISILINNGNATFQAAVNYNVGERPVGIFSADFNSNGSLDLAVTNHRSDNISILSNNGDGTFSSSEYYDVGDGPYSIFSADFDEDGDNDLAVANNFTYDISILFNLSIFYGSVCPSVVLDDGSPVQGVTVTLLDENNDPVSDPLQTDINGEAYFEDLPIGEYSVMIVKPLGYSAFPAETQTNIQVLANECVSVDFVLTPTIITNDCRTIGYWKHQFNVYTSGRGHAQESEADLYNFLDVVYQHFDELDVYVDLENFDFEDAKNILTVRGGRLMLERAKQQLFALLLNFASGRIGNETVVSDDDRVAAEAVKLVANLINDGDPANDELAKDISDLINNGQLVEAGIIPESNIRYKLTLNGILPKEFSVAQNFPNPFNAQTSIQYGLPEHSQVTIKIYDVMGRKVETLFDGSQQAGYHSITWTSGENSSGVYFYKIQAGEFVETRKMLLIK